MTKHDMTKKDFLKMTHEELAQVAYLLYTDSARLRAELDKEQGVIR